MSNLQVKASGFLEGRGSEAERAWGWLQPRALRGLVHHPVPDLGLWGEPDFFESGLLEMNFLRPRLLFIKRAIQCKRPLFRSVSFFFTGN